MSDEKPQDSPSTPDPQAKRKRRGGPARPFPAAGFEESLAFARQVFDFGSGQSVRRLSLFDHLGKAPDSGPSRQLITNANKYGLIKGNYSSDHLEITEEGARAIDEERPARERARARVKLAIDDIEPFRAVYERFAGSKLPARSALIDAMKEANVPEEYAEEAVDTFIVNLRFVELLQTLSGAERIVSRDHLLDSLPGKAEPRPARQDLPAAARSTALVTKERAQFETICFYIAPIGDDGSEHRRHSDLMLGSLVEPAIEPFSLSVLRADAIDKPGVITRQIIEYLLKARLVIADLSFHNPNVFYELAIRHACRLPVVQIIRAADRIPFDLSQIRTVVIDTTDIYSLVPRIDLYRSEIANQVRRALDDPDAVDNPITTYYPAFRVQMDALPAAAGA